MVKVRKPIVLPTMRSIFVPENERELQSLREDCGSRSPATRTCRERDLEGQFKEADGYGGKRAFLRPGSRHYLKLSNAIE
jgi:hypothetical protein